MVAKFSLCVSRLDEEITHFSAIADLLKREADASIFSSSPRLKPTMGETSGFNPEMKRLYLSKYVDLLSILYGS